MIKFVEGNLMESAAQALVNTVNLEGFMGKGIAYQFKKQYPKNFDEYNSACKNGVIQIGKSLVFFENEKIIINFPTKDKWRSKSKIEYIRLGLMDLVQKIKQLNIKSIAIPPLGTGNGGLNWNEVRNMMIEYLKDLENCEIFIYEPSSSPSSIGNAPKTNINHLILLKLHELSSTSIGDNSNSIYMLSFLLDLLSGQNAYKFDENDIGMSNNFIKKNLNIVKRISEYYGSKEAALLLYKEKQRLLSDALLSKFQLLSPIFEKLERLTNKFKLKQEWDVMVDLIVKAKKGVSIDSYLENHEEIINALLDNEILKKDLFEITFNNHILKKTGGSQ